MPADFLSLFEPRGWLSPIAGESPAATRAIYRSRTMCFPTRRTAAIRRDSSVAAISAAEDFNGSGFDPSHTDSMTSPVTRLARPRAIVSTSGSSGMETVYRQSRQSSVVRCQMSARPSQTTEDRRLTTAFRIAHPLADRLSLPVHISPSFPAIQCEEVPLGHKVCATLLCVRESRHPDPRSLL